MNARPVSFSTAFQANYTRHFRSAQGLPNTKDAEDDLIKARSQKPLVNSFANFFAWIANMANYLN